MRMTPLDPIAAVASSVDRNYRVVRISMMDNDSFRPHLNEGMVNMAGRAYQFVLPEW